VADVTEIDIEWLKGKKKVAVTAGASTPTAITREVIQYLEQFDENDPSTWKAERKVDLRKILPPVREKRA
jgi:4-hydroxy-3-methylbut-2-enyl diphosphate reductase